VGIGVSACSKGGLGRGACDIIHVAMVAHDFVILVTDIDVYLTMNAI